MLIYIVGVYFNSLSFLALLVLETGLTNDDSRSLKSLPIAKDGEQFEGVCSMVKIWSIDIGLMTDVASWLRKKLDLTIFGFDVVVRS